MSPEAKALLEDAKDTLLALLEALKEWRQR